MYKPWLKKDFDIVGGFERGNVRGHENDFVYRIYWKGRLLTDKRWFNKARASAWLGAYLKKANAIRKAAAEM